MIIIIDAYNILKQHIHDTNITESQRTHFIKLCGKYGKKKGHKMIVVFDAGPYDRPTQFREHNAYVVYSGIHETADTYIKRYLKKHQEYDVLLITSDSDVARYASRLGIPSMDSAHFHTIMQQEVGKRSREVLEKDAPAVKLKKEERPELDALMQEASKVVPTKSEDMLVEEREPKKKLSKRERQLMKKIKKL